MAQCSVSRIEYSYRVPFESYPSTYFLLVKLSIPVHLYPTGIQDLEHPEGDGDDTEDAKAEPSSGKLFYFPVVAENPNGDKVKYYKKLNRMEDQDDPDFTTASEVKDKNSRRMTK